MFGGVWARCSKVPLSMRNPRGLSRLTKIGIDSCARGSLCNGYGPGIGRELRSLGETGRAGFGLLQQRYFAEGPKAGGGSLGNKMETGVQNRARDGEPSRTQSGSMGGTEQNRAGAGNKSNGSGDKNGVGELGIGARIKYFLLRQNRPFNVDEITAFFSWILMGNVLWVLIGTTTFFGFLIYVINWIDDGEIERMFLKKLITFDNKLNVDLTDPEFRATWEDGKIKIRNLKIASISDKLHTNYELQVSELNLTFSFNKWMDGKGLIDGLEIDGLEGDVNMLDGKELILDDSFHDNYHLNYLKIKHSKVKFHSEVYFNKPIEIVLFNCDLGRVRRKWIVYDFLNASSMFGSLDGSLFTLHKRQNRFAHFTEMDLHDEYDDDFNNRKLNDNFTFLKKSFDSHNSNDNIDDTNDTNDRRASMVMAENNDNESKTQNGVQLNIESAEDRSTNENIWKKITRLRIDMLDLSLLNNSNSKLNWIESGKAEIIFDIMLPNDDDDDPSSSSSSQSGKKSLKDEFHFEFSLDGFKRMSETVYKKLTDEYDYETEENSFEQNKYVVIDMKINYYNLTAKLPKTLPCSSLTGLPYISSQDLQSLVTFINDEKFGLSSAKFSQLSSSLDSEENPFDGSDLGSGEEGNEKNAEFDDGDRGADLADHLHDDTDGNGDDSDPNEHHIKALPPIKFRIIQNLNDFEYLDLPSLLSFTSIQKPDDSSDERIKKSFVNTNKFIDTSTVEVFALLLVYKDEIQTKLIDMYSRRSGFEILFNNFILGNLILVGLGSFVI